jgi:hypothetical protein
MKNLAILPIVLSTLILSSCATFYPEYYNEHNSFQTFLGFRINSKLDRHWISDMWEKSLRSVIFRRHISDSHTFYAMVQLKEIALEDSSDLLNEWKKYASTINDTIRFKLLAFNAYDTTRQGLKALNFSNEMLDRNPANSFFGIDMIVKNKGFVVVHPGFKNTVIEAFYSERAYKIELKGEYDKFGEQFLSYVELIDSSKISYKAAIN